MAAILTRCTWPAQPRLNVRGEDIAGPTSAALAASVADTRSDAGEAVRANGELLSSRKRRRGVAGIDDSDDDEDVVVPQPDATTAELDSDRSSSESEGEGEDLLEEQEQDYAAMPALDAYERGDLDDRQYEVDVEARMAAEAELDRREGRLNLVDRAFADDDEMELDTAHRDRRRRAENAAYEMEDQIWDEEGFALENFDCPLRTWIATDRPRREIKRRWRAFLTTFAGDQESPIHLAKIDTMCGANLQSLAVSYLHLSQDAPILAIWLADAPLDMLEIFDEVTFEVVVSQFPDYGQIHDAVFTRITDLPISDSLRDLRQVHLNALVKVSGVVTKRTGVFPQIAFSYYDCPDCRYTLGPFKGSDATIGQCPSCQYNGPSGNWKLNEQKTRYRNYQKITLQESPGQVPPGRVPRHKDVILEADLIDRARPGEEIEVTGAYMNASYDQGLNNRHGFPVFSTQIVANYIEKREVSFMSRQLTEDDKREILRLSKEPDIADRIVESIAPSIWGHQHVKMALAMSLFGGRAKDVKNKHRIRGDINVLLLGDPGTAKSQMLKYAEKTAPRAVYTTGKGASAVGLTAAVHKDPLTREWTLEGGALVLADRGVCLIDEFDKMTEQDRTSIHEAMEQQSISISKAGIVTTLQARCSIIAAANPIGGRYDAQHTFAENVELTDPILQRFDILCVLQDTVDTVADERLARHLVASHTRAHPNFDAESAPADMQDRAAIQRARPIPQDLLRKYIMYARGQVKPQLVNIDTDKLSKLYAELRRESVTSGGVPIAVRHIESIMRMSEAHARMHLRDHVRDDDVDMAIRMTLESFIQAQKFSVMRSLRRGFQKYITYKKDNNELLLFMLQSLVKDQQTYMMGVHYPYNRMPFSINCDDPKLYNAVKLTCKPVLLSPHDGRTYAKAVFTSAAWPPCAPPPPGPIMWLFQTPGHQWAVETGAGEDSSKATKIDSDDAAYRAFCVAVDSGLFARVTF
eukprot:g663.t1